MISILSSLFFILCSINWEQKDGLGSKNEREKRRREIGLIYEHHLFVAKCKSNIHYYIQFSWLMSFKNLWSLYLSIHISNKLRSIKRCSYQSDVILKFNKLYNALICQQNFENDPQVSKTWNSLSWLIIFFSRLTISGQMRNENALYIITFLSITDEMRNSSSFLFCWGRKWMFLINYLCNKHCKRSKIHHAVDYTCLLMHIMKVKFWEFSLIRWISLSDMRRLFCWIVGPKLVQTVFLFVQW